MTILLHTLKDKGLILPHYQQTKRHEVIGRALFQHRHALSHFITLHPCRTVLLESACRVANTLLQILPGWAPKRRARAYVAVSLARSHLFKTPKIFEEHRVELLEYGYAYSDSPPIAPWHLHALVGALPDGISINELRIHIERETCWNTDVQESDFDERLTAYISDVSRGNLFSSLQLTTDSYINSCCLREGIEINWRDPLHSHDLNSF